MTRMLIGAMAALLVCGPACAQISTNAPSPLGITSPLGIGPGAPVPPTGLPLGTTELEARHLVFGVPRRARSSPRRS